MYGFSSSKASVSLWPTYQGFSIDARRVPPQVLIGRAQAQMASELPLPVGPLANIPDVEHKTLTAGAIDALCAVCVRHSEGGEAFDASRSVSAAAETMQLSWNGVLREGAPADLVVLQAGGWSDALRRPPQRQVLIAGRWWRPAKR